MYQKDTKNIWFENQKEPFYDPSDVETMDVFFKYWKLEKDRCINGFDIGGVHIPGRLYFHTVYWSIAAYIEKEIGNETRKIRKIITPILRDIDWDIFNDLEDCDAQGKFYDLVGSRDFGKSIIAASCGGWQYTFFSNSEVVISGGVTAYIKLVTDKIEDGLLNMHPMFQKQRITSDWKKEIVAGWKNKQTNLADPKSSMSSIKVRNYENGTKTMAANGTRPAFHLIDEIGTIKNLIGCIKDSDGCWWSGGGTKPSCLVFRTGCVCAGTKVWTRDGRLINIEDLKQEDGLIGYNGDSASVQFINWFKEPVKKECYKITTNDNNFIECSDDHPLLITRRHLYNYKNGTKIKKSFYQEAKELKINDQILIPNKIDVFGNNKITYARELGLMIGDGNYSLKSTPSLSVAESEIYDYIVNKYENLTFNKEYQISENKYFSQINIKDLKEKLVYHKMYGQSKNNKRLPYDIHTFNKQSVADLLGGYFDADGNVYYNKKKEILRIVLTSVVPELLQEVKYQLTKFGIQSSIIKEKRNSKPSKGYEGQQNFICRLYIMQQQDIQLFKDNISFLVQHKQNKLILIKKSKYQLFNTEFEINSLNNKKGYFNNTVLKDLRYVTVKKIEYIGSKEVYNLNCGPNHNYISNNFITRQTGGDMEVGKEAGEVFFNPFSYNSLEFDNPEMPGKKMGRFVSALRARMTFKREGNLYEYLTVNLGLDIPENEHLKKIKILISEEERAKKEWWDIEYDKAVKSGNPKTILKFKAYWPLKASDSFLILTRNDFDVELAKRHQFRLQSQEAKGSNIELYLDEEGKITHKFSDKLVITEFPVKTQDKNAPVVAWEFPIKDAPYGLYVAGVDPYRQGLSKYSSSLGAVYIYKRMHSITEEKYQDMFVAAYVARPNDKTKWHEQARLLIKYYNARTLVENDEISFIDYMVSKGDGHYLEKQPQWITEIVPNTTVRREYGIHRSSEKIRSFLHGCLKKYMEEIVYKETDDNGNTTKEIQGITKILDPILLEEVIQFDDDLNVDRVVAAELAIALAMKMDPIYGKIGKEDDLRLKSLYTKKITKQVFSQSRSIFAKSNKKMF